jgi:hypothetical protein
LFFLRNSSTEGIPPEVEQHLGISMQAAQTGSLNDTIMPGIDGSGEDDFHGIVDDLTIGNKEL